MSSTGEDEQQAQPAESDGKDRSHEALADTSLAGAARDAAGDDGGDDESGPRDTDEFKLAGTTLEGKFRVERMVAAGGFGIVYYGTHLTLAKPIAIKVLKTPPELNEEARAAFIDKFALEAKTIARIRHPNVVVVLDFGVSPMPSGERAPWMVLEWLTGETLEDELEKRRGKNGRSPREALALLHPVFEALAYSHEESIAHRDIKPANIMIVPTKRGNQVKLLDFGIAKLMEEGEGVGTGVTRTRSTMNSYSPLYAAPEQIGGARTGPWTDVHAMGLILSEVLTDSQPFEAEEIMVLMGQILGRERPTPAQRGVDVGPWEPVLAKALALRPEDRYRNAGEFLAALEGAMPAADVTGPLAAIAPAGGAGASMRPPPGASVPPPPLTPAKTPSAVDAPAQRTGKQSAVPGNGSTVEPVSLGAPAPAASAPKSRTGLIVGVAVVALLVGGGAVRLLSHSDNAQQGHAAAGNAGARSVPPPVEPQATPTSVAQPATPPPTTTTNAAAAADVVTPPIAAASEDHPATTTAPAAGARPGATSGTQAQAPAGRPGGATAARPGATGPRGARTQPAAGSGATTTAAAPAAPASAPAATHPTPPPPPSSTPPNITLE